MTWPYLIGCLSDRAWALIGRQCCVCRLIGRPLPTADPAAPQQEPVPSHQGQVKIVCVLFKVTAARR